MHARKEGVGRTLGQGLAFGAASPTPAAWESPGLCGASGPEAQGKGVWERPVLGPWATSPLHA